MRERRVGLFSFGNFGRITPACAGKTNVLLPQVRCNRDHPRMCGKDRHTKKCQKASPGSPPHVRERQKYHQCKPDVPGITPACAGKTWSRLRWATMTRDHPRMCGKDKQRRCHGSGTSGSPPHVRERLHAMRVYVQVPGITPACAGKTMSTSLMRRPSRDHPRMCGKDIDEDKGLMTA